MKKLILLFAILSFLWMNGFSQETGLLTGSLRDQLTNDPLFGVKVTAGGHVTRTDEAGKYNLKLQAGSYDVLFNRYGLYTLNLSELSLIPGDTLIIDTTMRPFPVPVSSVTATSMDNSTWLQITWSTAEPAIIEKATDNGEPDGFFELQKTGSQLAVKFENEGGHIIGGRILLGDSTFSCPFFGSELLVRVYDDEGMTGLPGNTLDEDTISVDQYGWFGFDNLDAQIHSDSYYLAIYQLNDTPYCAPVAYSHFPLNGESMMKYQDYNWESFTYGNAMIRPWETASHDSLRVYEYELARVSFNGLGDTIYTVLSHTGNLYYNDNAWGSQGYGCGRYAVKARYNNGQESAYRLSNIVCRLATFDVKVKINSSDTEGLIYANIRLKGQTPPFSDYPVYMLSPDTAGFNGVLEGKYQLDIYKPGYDKLVLDSIDIHSDTTFDITLQETCYPVENLRVNPFTALLTWEANSVSQFSWKCDMPGICHNLNTSELDLSTTEHWTLTVSYNYNSTVEAASVDYSTDHGRTWAEFYQLNPQTGWDTVNIDLSTFSGENGEQEIIFHIHDYQGDPFYLDISEVRVWTPDLEPLPQNCLITLNGNTAGYSDTTFYQLTSLVNGNSYHAGVYGVNCAGQTDTVFADFIYHQLFPPEDLSVFDNSDSLYFRWAPPSGSWGKNQLQNDYPDALIGYILHFDAKDISMHILFNDPLDTSFRMNKPTCDTSFVSVTALYDLTNYGYPGQSFESLPEGPIMLNGPGPVTGEFYEDWSSMSFYVNCWDLEGNGMAIEENQGNSGPALTFHNTDEPYQAYLTSYPIFIPQNSDGNLLLEFDLRLISAAQSGHETLEFQVNSEGSDDWVSVKGISNFYGNIDWMHFIVGLSGFVETDLFRIRLKFGGIGAEATNWTVDNIQVHTVCPGPQSALADKINQNEVKITWNGTEQKVNSKAFENYRIYRDYNETEYQLLAETGDTSYVDTLTYGGKYCYRVTAVYNEQGVVCESPLSDSACITSSLGIQDEIQNSRVVCYPNPAGEFVMIKSEEEIRTITLCNLLGTKVKTIEDPWPVHKLDLKDFPCGLYLLRIDLSKEVYQYKIIHLE